MPITIAAYGDSTIYGLTYDGDVGGPTPARPGTTGSRVLMPAPDALQTLLALAIPDITVTNNGVSGTTCADWLAGTTGVPMPWAQEMKGSTADWVLICLGINDDPTTFKAAYEQMVVIAQAAGHRVIIQTPNAVDASWATPAEDAKAADIRDVADAYPTAVRVDFYAYTQALGDEWKAQLSYSELFGVWSGIHPTQVGYDTMAAVERDILLPILCNT